MSKSQIVRQLVLTLIPSQRDTALKGLKARRVLIDLNAGISAAPAQMAAKFTNDNYKTIVQCPMYTEIVMIIYSFRKYGSKFQHISIIKIQTVRIHYNIGQPKSIVLFSDIIMKSSKKMCSFTMTIMKSSQHQAFVK